MAELKNPANGRQSAAPDRAENREVGSRGCGASERSRRWGASAETRVREKCAEIFPAPLLARFREAVIR
jgi:hypothetical protein